MLLRRRDETKTLAIIGSGVVLLVIIVAMIVAVNPFANRNSPERISVAIDTPYVGQGIQVGTEVVMHGVVVGRVDSVLTRPDSGVRLVADFDKQPTAGLTDAANFDFRPINYFGVPGINVVPAPGGQPLRDGSQISVIPKGNSTLTELLSQFGSVTEGLLTPTMISVADRISRYTDGMNPLFETMLIATTAVADVQTVSTAQLLANTSSASEAVPTFLESGIEASERFTSLNTPLGPAGPPGQPPFRTDIVVSDLSDETPEYFTNYRTFLDLASDGLFAAIGKLESSHVDDLLPLITGVKSITDTVPTLVRPEDFDQTMVELRHSFESLYAGNGEQRALQVRVLLDGLPGIAAPLGITGGA
ncbi:MlaD family protein [Mycobacterium sp. NPDC003449]